MSEDNEDNVEKTVEAEIDYKTEYSTLKAEIARLHEEAAGHRRKKREAETALEKYQAEDGDWQSKYNDLNTKVREKSHKEAFTKVAKDLKVRDEALEDVWALSKYTPEGDEPDEAHLKGLVKGLVEAKPYFLAPEEAKEQAQKSPLRPGPGVARPSLEPLNKTKVSRVDMRNPNFMAKYQKEISVGLSNGTMEIVD